MCCNLPNKDNNCIGCTESPCLENCYECAQMDDGTCCIGDHDGEEDDEEETD